MTAPDTNVKKQTKRHKGSLGGIALAFFIAIVVIAAFILWPAPEEATDATDTSEIGVTTPEATEQMAPEVQE